MRPTRAGENEGAAATEGPSSGGAWIRCQFCRNASTAEMKRILSEVLRRQDGVCRISDRAGPDQDLRSAPCSVLPSSLHNCVGVPICKHPVNTTWQAAIGRRYWRFGRSA